jgi:predicted DNA-binding protein with PD1-like motif
VRVLALRLRPGTDLRAGLEATAREHALAAPRSRPASAASSAPRCVWPAPRPTTTLEGPLEIVSLVGTLSPDGPHLHVAVADREGRVTGGHLLAGSPFTTTAEVVVALAPPSRVHASSGSRDGLKELVIRRRE